MEFDIVIGNPPYNNDLYLDFVKTGYQMLKDNGVMVMITPAKWQAKGGKKNEAFRQNIVPHMKEIVHYKDSKDVFNIGLSGGLSIFSIDKDKHEEKHFKIFEPGSAALKERTGEFVLKLDIDDVQVCVFNKIASKGERCLTDRFRIGYAYDCNVSIIDAVPYVLSDKVALINFKQRVYVSPYVAKDNTKINEYSLFISPWSKSMNKYAICRPGEIVDCGQITMWHGSNNEVESALSYFKCYLIQWISFGLLEGGCVGPTTFRFVPDPGQFDHIFTDAELYAKYGLTDEEIAIIESVIKERK